MIAAVLIAALALPAAAGGAGTSAAPLFNFNWGARPAAMGGAFVAAADDVYATLWNPAGLAFVPQPEASAMHAALVQGITYDQLAIVTPAGPRGGLGGHFAYMSTGGIDRTTEDPGGSFNAVTSGGSFRDSEFKLNLGGAGRPVDWLGLGGSVNYFRDTVDQNSADSFMIDMGALVRGGIMSYGLTLQNVGPQVRGQDTLPTLLRMGVAAKPNDDFLMTFDYNYHFDSFQNAFSIGTEYAFAKALILRLGFSRPSGEGAPAMKVTGGFGTAMGPFKFDYAFTPQGALGNISQVALSYTFGPKRGKAPPSKPEPVPTKKPDAEVPPEERFMRADVMIEAKNYAAAKVELAGALSLLAAEDRRRIRYFDRMGAISLAQNDLDGAMAFYGDGLKLGASLGLSDPDVADAYAGMGLSLVAKGNFAMGMRFLEKCLEFKPSPKTRAVVDAKLHELRKGKR